MPARIFDAQPAVDRGLAASAVLGERPREFVPVAFQQPDQGRTPRRDELAEQEGRHQEGARERQVCRAVQGGPPLDGRRPPRPRDDQCAEGCEESEDGDEHGAQGALFEGTGRRVEDPHHAPPRRDGGTRRCGPCRQVYAWART
ncbi:hypothetical protein Slala02_64970 [Streptomyces lavendulae subsp. lavendulae]|nr:hypothetical protein Slala02_64970 [Streptomyces lavendulae subsp. lavendulae]